MLILNKNHFIQCSRSWQRVRNNWGLLNIYSSDEVSEYPLYKHDPKPADFHTSPERRQQNSIKQRQKQRQNTFLTYL